VDTPSEAARAIEAILMVAQEPVETHLLAQLLEIAPARVEELCTELQAEYTDQERGFVLVKVAGGYRFQSHGDLAAYVERFVLEGQTARLSSAALETLAIVAYKQPLSRAQVAAIRGVNVDGVMRTLQQRGYVEEVGRDNGPGQATLFGTSREFLERMGLDRIEDLPAIAELFPSAEVMEALELTLRAAAPEPAPEPQTELDLRSDAVSEQPEAAEPDQAAAPVVIPDDDDFDEPVPPAWAIDPSPSSDPISADPSDGPVDGPVDLDGDGDADLPAEP
jgi:segregation and condensation protein B